VFAKGASIGDFELLEPAIYALVALTAVTVLQRVWHVKGALAEESAAPAPEDGAVKDL
jgi:phosphatidylinositol phosphate synthase